MSTSACFFFGILAGWALLFALFLYAVYKDTQ